MTRVDVESTAGASGIAKTAGVVASEQDRREGQTARRRAVAADDILCVVPALDFEPTAPAAAAIGLLDPLGEDAFEPARAQCAECRLIELFDVR